MKITIKTLDSRSYEFNIENDEITVKEFKEFIEPKVGISPSTQRLIFKGKVLHDDKKIKEYGVDGCVIHLVERAPPSTQTGPATSASVTAPNPSTAGGRGRGHVYATAVSTNNDLSGMAQQLVNSLISQFGAGNVSTSQSGTSLNVNVNVRAHNENRDIQNRLGTARRFLAHAEHLMQHVVEPSTTEHRPCPDSESSEMDVDQSASSESTSETTTPTEESSNTEESDATNTQETESGPAALGTIYSQILHLYEHLLPHLRRYENILHNPTAENSRQSLDNGLPDQMAEICHDLGHAFHAISDLSMSANASPPTLMCFPQMSPIGIHPPRPFQTRPNVPGQQSATQRTTSQTTTSSTQQTQGIPGFPAGSMPWQMGQSPVAMTAISSVMQIPVVVSGESINIPQNTTSETNISSSSSTTSNTSSTTSSSTNSIPNLPPGFQSFTMPGNSFSGMTGGNGHTSIHMGVFQGTPQMFAGASGATPQAVHVNLGGGAQGTQGSSNTVPPEVQQFMESVMRNSGSSVGGFGTASTSVSSSTSTISSSSSTSSTNTSGTNATPQPPNHHHHHHHHHHQQHQHHHRRNQPHHRHQPRQHHGSQQRTPNHRPHPHHHHHNEDGSVIHPDSLLPCQSFHFGPTFHQPGSHDTVMATHGLVAEVNIEEVANENTASTTQPTTTSNMQPGNVTNAGGAMPDLASMSNLLQGMFGSQATTTPNPRPGNVPNSGGPLSGLFQQMFGNMNTMNTNTAPTTRAAPATSNQTTPTSSASVTPDASGILQGVQQMLQTFMGMANQQSQQEEDQRQHGSANSTAADSTAPSQQTLRDFVRQTYGIDESGASDLLSDCMDVFADNMTLQDMFALFFNHSYEPLNRLHGPLRQLLQKYFNDDATMTEQSIPRMAERMAAHMNETYVEVEPQLTIRSDIDLNTTLTNIHQQHYEKLLHLLLDDGSSFGNSLHSWYVEYIAWLASVLDYTVTGGADRYMQLLFETPSVRAMFQDATPPALHQITLQTLTSRIRSVSESRHITSTELMSVLVKHGAAKATVSRTNPCKDSTDGGAAKRQKKDEKVDVNELWEDKNPSGGGASSSNESSDQEDSPPSPEDWHSRVPNDWVMLISRDVERQRHTPPQRPYSDAYINGLPPKRRKLMSQHSGSADRIDVKESIKSSTEKAGHKEKLDTEKLQNDVDEINLQEMFEATFRHDVRRRLQEDEDYKPNQFPQSEEYYMKGGEKKKR